MPRPPEFLWGAATSAHQVEGANIHNDWWQWEQQRAGHLRSGAAAAHYEKFREDFALARALGHTSHRLSIEWSRIEPASGQWNERAVAHYREVLSELRQQQLTSFVTLHHFTNPQWFAARGGWTWIESPARFERYVRYVAERLGDLVDYWITINEPMIYASHSFWYGRWPPQQRSLWSYVRAVRRLAHAHARAYRVLHELHPAAPVGIAQSVAGYQPSDPARWLDRRAVQLYSWWYNHRFFALTPRTHDFIGVNYYLSPRLHATIVPPGVHDVLAPGEPVSDLGWPIRPEGLTEALRQMWRYRRPLYVTENGVADAADSRRSDFIRAHLRAIEVAQAEGIDVRGYLHWSLLDNFEWAEGFTPRFGLVAVDYATQQRTVRPSAYVLRAIITAARTGRA